MVSSREHEERGPGESLKVQRFRLHLDAALCHLPPFLNLTLAPAMRCKFKFIALVFASTLAVAAATYTDGLIGYYPFNGDVSDESGHANDGTILGAPQLVADRFGNAASAYHFSQGVNRVLINNLPVDLASGGQNTLSFWMKWDGVFYDPNDVGAFPFVWGGAEGAHASVYLTGNQSWYPTEVQSRLGLNALAGHGETWGTSNPEGLDQWMQVVAVFSNGNDLRQGGLYINGQQVFADLFSAPGSGPLISSWVGPNAAIGGLNMDSDRYQFIGSIDDVRIYDRALSADEVFALYSSETQNVPETVPAATIFACIAGFLLFFQKQSKRS